MMNAPLSTPVLILAAGRGERMRPLTDQTPKPLLTVRGKPLMQWAMEALARGGFTDLVVNTAWLGEQVSSHFGAIFKLQPAYINNNLLLNNEQNSYKTELHIRYSREGRDFGGALETAGGIARALPLLCPDASDTNTPVDDVFWVLAGDVFAPDFAFSQDAVARFKASGKLAHIWLVPNPEHNLKGDFGIASNGLALNQAAEGSSSYTFSTIALYRKSLFSLPFCDVPVGNSQGAKAALAPLLRLAIAQQRVSAELYTGGWLDVGTPERLAQINQT